MRKMRIVAVFALAFAACGMLLAGDAVKSSLQPGEKIPGPFHPLNVNGAQAGKKHCLVCENGTNPVAMIFARECSEPLAKLVGELDAVAEKNKDARLGAFVVFLGEEDKLEKKLKDVAQDKKLKRVVLSIDNPAGPQGYNVAQDADVTVVLYTKHQVKANHAFKKGELKEKDVEKIVADVAKILPEK